ncbi:MAG: DegT/DnrJ/EryC1/StrS family aminotransferase [Candidatus Aenigmatarchaeota archaeon]
MKVKFCDLNLINKGILDEVARCIFSGQYILGPYVEEFENKFKEYIGVKYCVGVSSGTDAIELSARILGLKPGDSVISPVISFYSTVSPFKHLGVNVKYCHVTEEGLIDPDRLEEVYDETVKALIVVHLYGIPLEMNKILKFVKKHNLFLIEDCCQAHGAYYQDYPEKRVGSLGDISCFSFYPTKNLGGVGDGGAICTNNESYAELARALRDYGRVSKYDHKYLGFNKRLDAIQAAVLSYKLDFLDKQNEERKEKALLYSRLLKDVEEVSLVPQKGSIITSVYHIFPIKVKERNELMNYLSSQGIECLIHYPYILPQVFNESVNGFEKEIEFVNQELSLPIYPGIKEQEIEYVVEKIKKFYSQRRLL